MEVLGLNWIDALALQGLNLKRCLVFGTFLSPHPPKIGAEFLKLAKYRNFCFRRVPFQTNLAQRCHQLRRYSSFEAGPRKKTNRKIPRRLSLYIIYHCRFPENVCIHSGTCMPPVLIKSSDNSVAPLMAAGFADCIGKLVLLWHYVPVWHPCVLALVSSTVSRFVLTMVCALVALCFCIACVNLIHVTLFRGRL